MENKIYIKQLKSYQFASESVKKRMGQNPCFDLDLLPTETMQEEMRAFIIERSENLTVNMLFRESRLYNHLCKLIMAKGYCLNSFYDWNREKWMHHMKGWLLSKGHPLTYKEKILAGNGKLL